MTEEFDSQNDGNTLEAETEAPQAPPEATGADIAGLPVSLEIALPTISVPIEVIRQMTIGSTIPLDLDLTELMVIGANGRPLGEGRLVQIGDKIGLQIEKLISSRSH